MGKAERDRNKVSLMVRMASGESWDGPVDVIRNKDAWSLYTNTQTLDASLSSDASKKMEHNIESFPYLGVRI
jgi:hypothetical protein